MRISEERRIQVKDEANSRDWKRVEGAGSNWKQAWGGIWKAVRPEQSEKRDTEEERKPKRPRARSLEGFMAIVRTLLNGAPICLDLHTLFFWVSMSPSLFIRLPVIDSGSTLRPCGSSSMNYIYRDPISKLGYIWGPDGHEFQRVGWEII